MEFKYPVIMYIGFVIAAVFFIMAFLHKKQLLKKDGIKIANTELTFKNKLIQKEIAKYHVLRVMLVIFVTLMIGITASLLARPYYLKKIKEQKYNRDIILCMDISASVDELNLKLVDELKDTVRSLTGERIGIVIFNTTPVVLSPLTDDYEYTIEQLDNIYTAIKSQKSGYKDLKGKDWLYWNEYLYGGTLVGNELRGSSLIGDGLLGGLFAFPKTDENRTKIIIFSTDNDLAGDSYVTLEEACRHCKNNNVTVYGIGTKQMYSNNRYEMENAIELTGGRFFVEENTSEFHKIVEEIEETSTSLTEGKTIIKLVESPLKYFRMLVILFLLFVLISIILRRANVLWSIGVVAMAVLLVFTYVYAVLPANQFSKGPDIKIKKSSNLNVLFVIDNTISMIANDCNGERLTKVKEDAMKIVDSFEGANFSVISFNNTASLVAPFSKDTEHVKNAINSLYPIERFYATGSSLDTPKELMGSILKGIKEDANQKTAVIYISDGEITAENAVLSSFEELSRYIDGGMVLGYGTKTGGTMTIKSRYEGVEDEVILDYSDYPTKEAVSVIDEKNLKQVASDLGVKYVYMSDRILSDELNGVNEIRSEVNKLLESSLVTEEKQKVENSEEYIYPPKYYGFYALIPFAILLLLNAYSLSWRRS